MHARLLSWLEAVQLAPEFEPQEWTMLEADLGSLNQRQVVNGTWRSEALVVLAWALSRFELPSHDAMVDPAAVADSIFFLQDDALEKKSELKLRSPEDLEGCSSVQFTLHWRLRDYSLRPRALDFSTFAKELGSVL